MNPSSLLRGALILLSSCASAIADPTSYFPGVAADEKSVYTDWVIGSSSAYPRHAYMSHDDDDDDDGGAAVFWNVDGDAIHLAIVVRALGWVGVGFSEAGGMIGSDVAIFRASDPSVVVDAHVVGDRSTPMTDDCQDWTLDAAIATGEDGWMIVEISRSIDTGDSQDRAIVSDADLWHAPTRMIAAWGDDDEASYHGARRARGSVRIFANYTGEVTEGQALLGALEVESDGFFDVVQDEYDIPAEETTYHYLCKTFDELNITSSVTMTGAKNCDAYAIDSFLYRTMLYGWAPGDEGVVLPNDVGLPLFDDENKQAISVEIHYHNPSLLSGTKDSSGIRFYYANNERTHRAGILEIGDPWIELYDTKINDGLTQYSFTCPGECSSTFLAQEGVTILAESLHMHKTGVRMTNEVIRGGEVFHKAVVDVYDFDQQGSFQTPQEAYQLLPGDSFRTTCYYKDGSKFGIGSEDEMCIAFIWYYPARSLLGMPWICPHGIPDYGTGCSTELEFVDLDSDDDLGRSFGVSSGECAAKPTVDTSTIDSTSGLVAAAFPVSSVSETPAPSESPTRPVAISAKHQGSAAGFSFSFVTAVSVLMVSIFMLP
ncbi:hypothetical protein ACHAW5_010250 [Stephanodiscus triporus]|uniref:DOMON domain-containing protein n=1 Tax=Stephanodiscus triporus TaxID=2934178 RepID=A0ABD3P318_9STRA